MDDDATRREAWVLRIRTCLAEARDELENADKEARVLEFMLKTDPTELRRIRDERERKIEEAKELVAERGVEVTRIAADLTTKREVLQEGVFKPYHRLPTVSLEEFAEREMAQLREREARAKASAAASSAADADAPALSFEELAEQGREDDVDAHDKATLKARRFEDWKDGVPRGSGVTKRL